ncbi:MAG: DNA/RNA helicase domain-containing protein, partial [Burkholderiales bacterium]
LDDAIRRRAAEGHSARLTAGFCWKWSQPKDGRLVDDVVIGDFRRPWNAQPEATRLPKDVPKSHFWATDPRGINQVGCVYTAQGFEFDYAGVIWGPDLVYRKDEGWVGVKTASFDRTVKTAQPEYFIDLVKNTYRVLLTRGMKGCYVFFTDEETRRFVISRLSQSAVEV